jgi:hypothetical protein
LKAYIIVIIGAIAFNDAIQFVSTETLLAPGRNCESYIAEIVQLYHS